MAEQSVVKSDLYVAGNISATSMTVPDGTITNAMVKANTGIAASKLVHRHMIRYNQAVASAIVADTAVIHIARAAGTIISIEAIVETVGTGADRTVTVDLLKGNASTAFATVLSGTIGFTNGSAARTVVAGTISAATLADNDCLKLTVAVAGAAGAQALGLGVIVCYEESPQ